MKRLRTICLVLLVTAPLTAEAAVREFRFDQESSHLEGSIKYALIGTYEARFREFGGVLKLDDRDIENSSVELKVSVDSIRSRYPRLDRIVRSDRLLDTATYPTIDFKSRAIRRLADGYQVDGRVRLHNISKDLSFRFFSRDRTAPGMTCMCEPAGSGWSTAKTSTSSGVAGWTTGES